VAALDVDFTEWDLPANDRLVRHVVDLTDADSVNVAVSMALASLNACDSVIANAAIVDTLHRAESFPDGDWDRDLAVNLSGTFRLIRRLFPALRDSADGRVVAVSSMAAEFGQPAQVAYAASKAGLIGMIKTLAVEWGPLNICCNVVMPGVILTPKVSRLPIDVTGALMSRIPLGRFATPSQVAGVIAFLLSPAAACINGAVLSTDAGFALNNIALTRMNS
jgi:3-oxoacyl-[acyl-carrier protein] reductase